MSDPRTLLEVAVAANPRGKAGVADEIGYSRTAVSLYLSGEYRSPKKLEAAVISRYDRRHCPHTGEDTGPDICRRRALSPKPYGGNARERQWQACQSCPHKPAKE